MSCRGHGGGPCRLPFVAVLLLGGWTAAYAASGNDEWKEVRGEHFVVFYHTDAAGADRVMRAAEDDYSRIGRVLGIPRFDNFWTWDRRLKIRLYATRGEFMAATGAPEWAGGKAEYGKREIAAYAASTNFLGSILTHELTHVVFREYIGFGATAPLWLDEGVAQWMESGDRGAANDLLRALAARQELIPLRTLATLDVRQMLDSDDALRYYAHAAGFVGWLITEYGGDRFAQFCRRIRDGKPLEESLRFTYGQVFRTMEMADAAWAASLGGGKR